jgi:uncharacterized protein (UPF0261 family)
LLGRVGRPSGSIPLAAIGMTILTSLTQPAAEAARRTLEEHGHVVHQFEADGSGGPALETAVRDGRLDGVLDLTLAELAANLVGGVAAVGPDRLTAASLHGVPQVICFGGLDLVDMGSGDSLPERFSGRKWSRCNGRVLVRTSPQENDSLGKEIAYKVSASGGLTAACLPLRGLSSFDVERHSFRSTEANEALFASFLNWVGPQVTTYEWAYHINDLVFAMKAAEILMEMLFKELAHK